MKTFVQILGVCLLGSFYTLNVNAQNHVIEGRIVNLGGSPMEAASVVALAATDSVLLGFAITDEKGRFRILDLPSGNAIVKASFLGYEDAFVDVFIEEDTRKSILEDVIMNESDNRLEEVTIKAYQIPVRIKKDTIVYNAGAFKTAPNAAVEDLLKKMPGIEVNKQGQIKAQGETVNQVLVEGKEFFGTDPKVATKNLPADAVDKVQVFDKQSEMAEFSGIEDGQEQKTINLQLKEDRKSGQFGNYSAGYGTKDRFEGKFNINRFGKETQISGIGMANNINDQGFSIMEYIDFMGGLSSMMSSGGGIRISSDDLGVPLAFGGGQGFVRTISGGLNFNRDFSKNTELNSSYFYSQIKNDIERTSLRETLLTRNNFSTSESSTTESKSSGHTVNFKLANKIDTSQWITVRGSLAYNDGFTNSSSQSVISGNEGGTETEQLVDAASNGDRLTYNFTVDYNRRIGKKSRIFSASGNISNRNDENEAFLNSIGLYSGQNGNQIAEAIDQRQLFDNDQMNYRVSASYTEPLGNRQYLTTNYSRQNYGNSLVKDFYDIVFSPNRTEVINDQLSQNYDRQYIYDRIGTNYKLNRKKYNLSVGVQYQSSRLNGRLNNNGDEIRKSFQYFLPNLRFNYEFANSRNLTLTYRTNIREPSLEQLQPLVDNTNPLSIYIGNPELQPEYRHNVNVHYMSYSAFNDITLFLSVDGILTRDKIANAQSIDDQFVQTTTPINVRRDYILSDYLSFSAPLNFLGVKLNLQQELNFNRGILFVNTQENKVNRWDTSFDLSLDNRKKEVWDVRVGANIRYNNTQYSENDDLNQDFTEITYYTDLTGEFMNGWFLSTSFDFTKYSDESFGSQTDLPLWRASISKGFLKGQKGQLKLSIYDILDRNLGISRSSNLNFLEETRVTSLSRYLMLTFSFNFAGFGAKKDGVFHIETNRRRR